MNSLNKSANYNIDYSHNLLCCFAFHFSALSSKIFSLSFCERDRSFEQKARNSVDYTSLLNLKRTFFIILKFFVELQSGKTSTFSCCCHRYAADDIKLCILNDFIVKRSYIVEDENQPNFFVPVGRKKSERLFSFTNARHFFFLFFFLNYILAQLK